MCNINTLSTNPHERINMNLSMRFLVCLFSLTSTLSLSSCQSTQAIATAPAPSATAPTATTPSAGMSAKQQEYEQMLQEWKTLKPGLQRMLVIEEEMSQLIGQLALLADATQNTQATNKAPTLVATPVTALAAPTSAKTAADTTEPSAASEPEPTKLASAPVPISISAPALAANPAPAPAPETSDKTAQNSDSANYSLQVASLTELKLLPKKWQEMRNTHPQLLADLTPNFQAIKVNNTTYYRLKIGGFSTMQDANKKCSELQSAGISCLPAKYSESNFAQI
jgi:cell division protein FtsN